MHFPPHQLWHLFLQSAVWYPRYLIWIRKEQHELRWKQTHMFTVLFGEIRKVKRTGPCGTTRISVQCATVIVSIFIVWLSWEASHKASALSMTEQERPTDTFVFLLACWLPYFYFSTSHPCGSYYHTQCCSLKDILLVQQRLNVASWQLWAPGRFVCHCWQLEREARWWANRLWSNSLAGHGALPWFFSTRLFFCWNLLASFQSPAAEQIVWQWMEGVETRVEFKIQQTGSSFYTHWLSGWRGEDLRSPGSHRAGFAAP